MRQAQRRFSESFGAFVRDRRGDERQVTYALRAGISAGYLSQIEAGLVPGRAKVTDMAERLGEDVATWLLEAGYPVTQEGERHAPTRGPAGASELSPFEGPAVGEVDAAGQISLTMRRDPNEEMPMIGVLVLADPPPGLPLFAGDRILYRRDRAPRKGQFVVLGPEDGPLTVARYVGRRNKRTLIEPTSSQWTAPVETDLPIWAAVVGWLDAEA